MSASEPDSVQGEIQRRWLLSVWSVKKNGEIFQANYYFWSNVKTIDKAFELIHANGLVCVRKNHTGKIVPNGKLQVRLSTGEL